MNTSDLFKIPMEVQPHVKKYLEKLYGDEYIISKMDSFGKMIMLMLTRDINNVWECGPLKNHVKYTVFIPWGVWHNEGVSLDSKNRLFFNEIANQYFREKMYDYVVLQKRLYNRKFTESIREYLKLYNITEDDLKFETIMRDFKRKKELFKS